MAIDFGILERTPTIASRFMAGQEAARAEQERNMLLQQRQMQFQQEQENRLRTQQREAQFEQMANLIREHGADPDDPQVLGKFAQAAFLSKQPQLASFVESMMERAAKRRAAKEEATFIAGVYGGQLTGALPTAAAPAAAMPSAASMVAPAAAAPEPMPAIPYSIRPGEVSPGGAVSAGVAPPVEVRLSAYGRGAPAFAAVPPPPPAGEINTAAWRAMAPVAPPPSGLPVNALAPEPAAAPANAMLAPPAAPAVQVAGPAALPTPTSRIDVPKLEAEVEKLEAQQTAFRRRGTPKALQEADKLQKEIDTIRSRIDRATAQAFRERDLTIQQQRADLETRRADLQEARDRVTELRFQASQKQSAEAAARTERQLGLAERRFNLAQQQFQLANDPEHQARLTQIREGAKLAAKSDSEVLTQGPSAVEAGQRTLALLNRMVGDPKGSGAAARAHPGFEGVVGAGVPGLRFVQGTPEADFDAMLKQAQGGAFLEAYERLKGTGQITEVEGQKATQAITRMNTAVSEAEFMQAAKEFREAIESAMKRTNERLGVARGRAPGAAPAAVATPAAAGRTYPAPPQTAIDLLKKGQGTDAQFDEIFGPGAAAKARGGR